ncbi:probable serine/threonine-protein kinase DDB_G0282963 isoform X11 [Episyrphus balteatus]|uniref:probable serine/threonine-protein kinase DDB_G0282963 isoform X11 n=1 Tax=Episyrphus balteatus TaxID=286459 RepID=UPI002486804E|nr:probable serine/threonine-protein kinase DDB_G0282963 isoform X11 [Episyrphus balteatus]
MDLSLERDGSALGSLFQQIIADMKNTTPLWDDFLAKAGKLHACLRAAIQAIAAYLDAFQKIADAATNSRGASKEIGTALTRVCLRHKAVETRLKTFTSAIMDCLVLPLQDKLEDWKRQVATIDKEHAKEHKRCRAELKKRSTDTLRLQKKARKGQSDAIQSLVDSHMHDVTMRRAELEEVEKKSLRSAMIEERMRYCTFVYMLQPVVKEECEVMSELGHLQEAMQSIANVTKEPNILPPSSEELIHDAKSTMNLYPESPGGGSGSQGCSNSLGSRKSSVCSISSMNSSGSSGSPGHHHYPRSLSQLISPTIRLKPGESSDSGFCSSPALTSQASTATSQSHAVSTWPPHSQDVPSTDRPHTISSAYEKGHQRPALTVYTFQNPETIMEASATPTPTSQKSPGNVLCRPPLPVRCSSLERPLSANNNARNGTVLLPRQCPSPIPAHVTKASSSTAPLEPNHQDSTECDERVRASVLQKASMFEKQAAAVNSSPVLPLTGGRSNHSISSGESVYSTRKDELIVKGANDAAAVSNEKDNDQIDKLYEDSIQELNDLIGELDSFQREHEAREKSHSSTDNENLSAVTLIPSLKDVIANTNSQQQQQPSATAISNGSGTDVDSDKISIGSFNYSTQSTTASDAAKFAYSDSELSRFVSETSSLGFENPTFAHFVQSEANGDDLSIAGEDSISNAQRSMNDNDSGSGVVVIYDHTIPCTPDIDYCKQNSEIVVLRTKDPQTPEPSSSTSLTASLTQQATSGLLMENPKQRLSSFRSEQYITPPDNNNRNNTLLVNNNQGTKTLKKPTQLPSADSNSSSGTGGEYKLSKLNLNRIVDRKIPNLNSLSNHNNNNNELSKNNNNNNNNNNHNTTISPLSKDFKASLDEKLRSQQQKLDSSQQIKQQPSQQLQQQQQQQSPKQQQKKLNSKIISKPLPPLPPLPPIAHSIPSMPSHQILRSPSLLSSSSVASVTPSVQSSLHPQVAPTTTAASPPVVATVKPSISPRPASLSGCGTRIARRSSVNTAKPPPPVRRSSSVTPSHNQSTPNSPNLTQQNTMNNSVENLPPPPAYLLDRQHSNSVPQTISAAAASSIKVAETVKALSAIRHTPASPSAIRRAQNMLNQQQQQQTATIQSQNHENNIYSTTPLMHDASQVVVENIYSKSPPQPPPKTQQVYQHYQHPQPHSQVSQQQQQMAQHYNHNNDRGGHYRNYNQQHQHQQSNHHHHHQQVQQSLPSPPPPPHEQSMVPPPLPPPNPQPPKHQQHTTTNTNNHNNCDSNSSFRTSCNSPGIYAQPKQVSNMSSFRSSSPGPQLHQQSHTPPAQPKTNPILIAQLNARLNKQQQQSEYGTYQIAAHQQDNNRSVISAHHQPLYGSTPSSPHHQQHHHHQQQQLNQIYNTATTEQIYSRQANDRYHQGQQQQQQLHQHQQMQHQQQAQQQYDDYSSVNNDKSGSIRSKTKAEFLENLNAKLAKQGISGRAFAVRNLINSKALPDPRLCHESLMDQIKRGANLKRNQKINDRSAPKIH